MHFNQNRSFFAVEKKDDVDLPSIDWGRADMLIELALNEDLDTVGDVTTNSVIPEDMEGRAVLRCKSDGTIVAGLAIAERVFKLVEPRLEFKTFMEDGELCNAGDEIAAVEGPVRGILTGERTALNFLQRLSGIATTTNRYAKALEGSKTQLLDTRKTTPGYRNLEKYAVAVGGGSNHRMGLFDRVMIKDNHRELAALGGGDNAIAWAVAQARTHYPELEIEVEADTVEEAAMAAEAGVEYILLDNMSNEEMAEAVKVIAGRAKTEASGGITIERLPEIGRIGVDFVSSGALTHSVKSADISLDIEM
jgi:nicotinate-nucleotide pyrophosphorylase (carboxylating)